MRHAYEALLRLYPTSWRTVFGQEMASVFEQATGDYQPRGFLTYAAFLRTEFSGLIAGAFVAWTNEYLLRSRRRLNAPFVISLLAGAAITALCQGCLYTGREGVGSGFLFQIRVPETPQASLTYAMPFILAIGCLLLISVLSAAFVLNMRVIGNRAGGLKPIWMPGRAAAATRMMRRGPHIVLDTWPSIRRRKSSAKNYEIRLDSPREIQSAATTRPSGRLARRISIKTTAGLRIVTGFASIACFGQAPVNQTESAPRFEVASVRLTSPGADGIEGFRIQTFPESVTTRGLSLKECIIWAYRTQAAQIVGPDWLEGVRLDIVGKAATPSSQEELYLMLRTLLVERLGLRTHVERREMPVYVLTIAKGGSKFSESATDGPLSSSQDKGALLLRHVSIFDLAAKLSGRVFDRPIVDETGLKGRYDIRLDMAAAAATNPDDRMDAASAMISALRDQMGLKVEGRKQVIDVLVIDHVEKTPTEN